MFLEPKIKEKMKLKRSKEYKQGYNAAKQSKSRDFHKSRLDAISARRQFARKAKLELLNQLISEMKLLAKDLAKDER